MNWKIIFSAPVGLTAESRGHVFILDESNPFKREWRAVCKHHQVTHLGKIKDYVGQVTFDLNLMMNHCCNHECKYKMFKNKTNHFNLICKLYCTFQQNTNKCMQRRIEETVCRIRRKYSTINRDYSSDDSKENKFLVSTKFTM